MLAIIKTHSFNDKNTLIIEQFILQQNHDF